jgi:DNA-directed RNA polymerase alpha subunit
LLAEELPEAEKPKQPEPQPDEKPKSEPAQEEDVSSRTWTILKRNGLPDMEAVQGFVEAKGADALKEIDGIGKKSLDEILSALEE